MAPPWIHLVGPPLLGSGLLLFLASCAAFHPPISTSSPPELSSLPSAQDQELPSPTLTGRQEGVALRLFWDHSETVRIYRRNILEERPFELLAIVDPAAGNTLIDSDVDPGSVYAYRARIMLYLSGPPLFGPFSDELYLLVEPPGDPPEKDLSKEDLSEPPLFASPFS